MFNFIKISKRLSTLEEDFIALRREYSKLEMEWLDLLERNKRLMGRIAKRQAYLDRAEEAQGATEPLSVRPVATSGQIDPISAKILARRGNRALLGTVKEGAADAVLPGRPAIPDNEKG